MTEPRRPAGRHRSDVDPVLVVEARVTDTFFGQVWRYPRPWWRRRHRWFGQIGTAGGSGWAWTVRGGWRAYRRWRDDIQQGGRPAGGSGAS
nr:hypothetical protein [Micromonospora sp. DSM 115978]